MLFCSVCIALIAGVVQAVDEVTLHLERVTGAGWSAEGVSIRFDLPGDVRASATIDRAMLPGSRELRKLHVSCTRVELSDERIACREARLDAQLENLAFKGVSAAFVYGRRDGSLHVELSEVPVARGTARILLAMRKDAWSSTIDLRRVAIEPLMQIARDWQLPLPAVSAVGEISGTLSALGSGGLIRDVDLNARVLDLTASNDAGSLATDKLAFGIEAKAQRSRARPDDWSIEATLGSKQGQAYAQPVFLDLSARPIEVAIAGDWRDSRLLTLNRFRLDHKDVALASGSVQLDFKAESPVRGLALDLSLLRFPGAYEAYLQPFLLDTGFKSMTTAGALSGRIEIADAKPQRIDLEFDELTFDDGSRNFALGALSGDWHWLEAEARSEAEAEAALASRLRWRDGTLLGLGLGAGAIEFVTEGRELRLLEPARIPVLDGAIELDSFRVRNAGMPTVAFIVDATIRPISVEQLCEAFGWPRFGGSVGGVVSKLRMRDGIVTLGTTLQAQVFDGGVSVSDLRLEQPFGQWPRLHASIGIDNLDLALVTRAFSFGLITGRLSGAIENLELFNWTPVSFDARLHTPPGDRSRHRISQRAVENIGSIGGGGAGVTAALSSGFLRFFEEFNYDQLGISCRLENEVCRMDGIAPAPNGGYYLVKGKGVPRIDVIGNSRRVDWTRLVQQLIAVTESEGPQVR